MTDRPETVAECSESLHALTGHLRTLLEATGLGHVATLRTDASRPMRPSVFLSTAPDAPVAAGIGMQFRECPRIRYWRLCPDAADGGRTLPSCEMFPARWERQAAEHALKAFASILVERASRGVTRQG